MDAVLTALLGVQTAVVGLLIWVARRVFSGDLVPRSTLERVEREKADVWAAYQLEREVNRENSAQLSRMLTAVREATTT